jgi:thioesterase domain-containing protein
MRTPCGCSVNSKPVSSTIEALGAIWQRVLQRPSIGATENFFDLGGTPSSAARLFAEIAAEFARDFPPVTICVAPTIKALAALLNDPKPPRIPPLLLLKDGAGNPPVFIAHGLGGDVLGLAGLARKIESPHPIYGMQAGGIDGIDEPLSAIDEMAQFHLSAIQQVQTHGPYFLIGYSLGGLVMLEIARRLMADGNQIALLALLDSYPDKRRIPVVHHMLLSLHQAKRFAGNLIESAQDRRRSKSNHNRDGNEFQRDQSVESPARVLRRMRDAHYVALRSYRPQFYRGRIKFVRAEISTHFPANPTAVWAQLAETFEVETVPGDHVGMMATHFEHLAAVLSRYLAEALP